MCKRGTPLLKFLVKKLKMFELVLCASSNRNARKRAFAVFVGGRVTCKQCTVKHVCF